MALSKLARYGGNRVLGGAVTLLLLFLVGCGGPSPVINPTPTPVATQPQLGLQFTTIDLNLPPAALDAPVIGSVPAATILHVSITFKINQQALDQLNTKKVQKGQSTNLEGLANKLGISDQDYQKIKAFFGIENATLKLNKLHTNLTVDARAGTFARLFQTHFVVHKLNGRTFFTPAAGAPPKLPTFIASQVVAITGLDNYSIAPRRSGSVVNLNAVGVKKSSAGNCTPAKGSLTASDIASLYGYDQLYKSGLHGEGITVNLVEFDGLSQSDLQNYLGCVNYQGKIKVVDVKKAPATGAESTLDVEMIAGLAPAVNINDYDTDLNSIQTFNDYWTLYNDVLQQIINDNAQNTASGSIVNLTWGAPEGSLTKQTVSAIDQSLAILTKAEHMSVFVASGDCGAFDLGDYVKSSYGQLAVDYPASDPFSVAVGGTSLTVNQQNNSLNEVVWSNGSNHNACKSQWGSGGGLSQVFQRPQWQTGQVVQNKYANGARQLPDVSALAIYVAIYLQGQWLVGFGTTLSAPIWAAGTALVNEGTMQQTKVFLYGPLLIYDTVQVGAASKMHPFFDVTRGNNLYYDATPGWDYATGFGSPNMKDFFPIVLAITKQH